MAYHDSYWSRWAPEGVRRRGRPKRKETDGTASTSALVAACDADGGEWGGARDTSGRSPKVSALAVDGGGGGRRVRDDTAAHYVPCGGKKRGRPPKAVPNTELNTAARKRQKSQTRKRLRWTDTGREEFNRVQRIARSEASSSVGLRRNEWTQQFGRGEGGGVT